MYCIVDVMYVSSIDIKTLTCINATLTYNTLAEEVVQ